MGFDPFLKQLAAHYSRLPVEELTRVSFVFPNRRSGYFFSEYFKEAFKQGKGGLLVLPEITTLSSLVERWSGLVEATQVELQMLVYRTYLDLVMPKVTDLSPALEPERFLFWADIILSDFNDIDRSLTDAAHLFRNLKDLKELQTNPLDEAQLELVRQFWDTTRVPWLENGADNPRMWVLKDKSQLSDGVRNFLKLWEIMGPLYDSFRETLLKEGLCYIGMAYRWAVERLERMLDTPEILNKDKFVFIGFSNLSEAEKEIFGQLQKAGMAAFHWDTNLPVTESPDPFPLRIIESYRRRFPEPESVKTVPVDYEPDIKVYSVPSEIGQVKKAAEILRDDNGLSKATALNYAVVLPETTLCLPLLNSLRLPAGVEVNITMGYPLDRTPMAAVLDTVAVMLSAALDDDGAVRYRRHDVARLLSHPLLMNCAGADCLKALETLSRTRRLYVPAADIEAEAGKVAFLFKAPETADTLGVLRHILGIVDRLTELYGDKTAVAVETEKENGMTGENQDSSPDPAGHAFHSIDYEFLVAYRASVEELILLIGKYDLGPYIQRAGEKVFATVNKMLRRLSLSFVGTPLKGIQVMGVLETRALDFETVIITSMNERSFPRKLQKATFIPQSLRGAYGMERRGDEETVMAYHFYRLIGRARNVHLLYNNDTEGVRSGEMSRYLYQLKYMLRPRNFTEYNMKYTSWVEKSDEITLVKTPDVMRRLGSYLASAPEESRKYLSASSIKRLLSCELQFFLTNVCGFAEPDEDSTHIDDSVYGTIVHTVMQNLYMEQPREEFKGQSYPRIDAPAIDRILKGNTVEKAVTRTILSEYLGHDEKDVTGTEELDGETAIFRQMAVKSVRALLEAEKKYLADNGLTHFLLEKVEVDQFMQLELEPGLAINFEYIIDRVDRVFEPDGTNHLRIVDYKTGKDALEFNGIESLVDYDLSDNPPKAITQLMLYSIAYAADSVNGVEPGEPIQPVIYRFRDIVQEGGELKPLKNKKAEKGKGEVTDYNDYSVEFLNLFNERIKRLLDSAVDFRQPANTHSCRFCDFKSICNRK